MKGSPSRKEQRKASIIALTKGYGSQSPYFHKGVAKRKKKRKMAKISRKINRNGKPK